MTDFSPLDSCLSIGSDGDKASQNVGKKKHSTDSLISDISMRTDSHGFTPDEESIPKRKDSFDSYSKAKYSSAASSETDDSIQNNERCISNLNKEKKVGQNVNELYVDKVSKINSQLDNLTKLALADGEEYDSKRDQKNSHRIRTVSKQSTSSNKSVSIEMDGDNLCVTTEELDDDVLVGAEDSKRNLSNNVSNHAKAIMCSQSQSDNLKNNEPVNDGTINNVGNSEGHDSDNATVRTSNIPQHPQSLNLSAINTTNPPNNQPYDVLETPDISVTRHHNSSSSSTTTSGPDSGPPSPLSSSPSSSQSEPIINLDTPSSPESLSHNLQFPENSISGVHKNRDKKSAKEQVCGVFSVDLGNNLVVLL